MDLLGVWTRRWGNLSEDLQRRFLDDPRMVEFQSFGLVASADAIRLHKKLTDALAYLQRRKAPGR